jgi:hypothetical protein
LEFVTQDGTHKRMWIPVKLLATDGAEVIRRLKAAGLEIAPGADDLVLMYLVDRSARLGTTPP